MSKDKIIYDTTWVKNELKHMKPHEYMKRYELVYNEHTLEAACYLMRMLMEEMSALIEKANGL